MQRLEVSCEVPHIYIYMSLGAKRLKLYRLIYIVSPSTLDRYILEASSDGKYEECLPNFD